MSVITPSDLSLKEAIDGRRSVRGFLDEPVPDEILKQVFEQAASAPSNCNVQPWRVLVASGETRNELRERMVSKAVNNQGFNPDHEEMPKFEGVYRDRQVGCAMELYSNIGVDRHDKIGRAQATLRNFELFDAPHVAFIGMQRDWGVTLALDVGIYLQTLMLTMTGFGISSCAQGSMRYFPDDVREVFGEPESTAIVVGLSFGYEDTGVAANKTRVGRAQLSENVVFSN